MARLVGFSAGDDVPSSQDVREGFFLDGRQIDVSHVSQSGEDSGL